MVQEAVEKGREAILKMHAVDRGRRAGPAPMRYPGC